jgi:hypothetical protein
MMYKGTLEVSDCFLNKIDTKLLRDQRDAIFTSIDDAEDFAQYGDTEIRKEREKHIQLLDGVVNMIDAMLDEIELVNNSESEGENLERD